MRGFFRFFAKRPLLANVITIVVIALGVSIFLSLNRDTYPNVEIGEMSISTYYPGASPQEVELKVTNKIEDELKSVSGIERYISYSAENISLMSVVLDSSLDQKTLEIVKRDVRNAVNRITDLPQEITQSPEIEEVNTGTLPIVEVGITGDIAYADLRLFAGRIEKKLKTIDGVSRLSKFGWKDREVQIEVDPEELSRYQLSLQNLVLAIKSRNVRSTAGTFESYTSESNIVTLAQFQDPMEVRDVILRSSFEGPLIKIKDVAKVTDDFQQDELLTRISGKSAISFLVMKSDKADIIRTVEKIKVMLAKEQANLPKSVKLMLTQNKASAVQNNYSAVLSNGFMGIVLVIIVLALFLDWRTAIWVANGIPVSLCAVFIILPYFGLSLDSITLTTMILAIGMVVDGSIMLTENVHQKLEAGEQPFEATITGIVEIYPAVMTTTFTSINSFLPLFFLSGIMGKFCFVIPLTICFSLLVSMLESTLCLPSHLAQTLKKYKLSERKSLRVRVFDNINFITERIVGFVLKFRYTFILLFIVIFSLAIIYANKCLDFVLFPSNIADQIYVKLELPGGYSLKATADKVKEIEKIIDNIGPEELSSYVTRIGIKTTVKEMPQFGENYGLIQIALKPFRIRNRTADQIVESLREKTKNLQGFQSINFLVDTEGPPIGKPITIRVISSDDDVRRRLTQDVIKLLSSIAGVKDIERDDKYGKNQVEIKLNYETLARLGLTVADIAQTVRIAYDGETVGRVRYGNEDVEFRILFDENARKNQDYLGSLLISNAQGRLIKLNQIAEFIPSPGLSSFRHYNGERTITVNAEIEQSTTTALKVMDSVLNKFDLIQDYPGAQLIIGGEAQESEKSINNLIFASVLALLGIYLQLVLLFGSIFQPLIVGTSIAFGIFGVIFAFAVHRLPITFTGGIGIVGLTGFVVNDPMVIINHLNELWLRYKGQLSLAKVVSTGMASRVRSMILTTGTTIAGLLPIAYGIGGASPLLNPLALAVGYGVLFNFIFTLTLIPCMYLVFEDLKNLWGKVRLRILCKVKK